MTFGSLSTKMAHPWRHKEGPDPIHRASGPAALRPPYHPLRDPLLRGFRASIPELWSVGAQAVLRGVSDSVPGHAQLHPMSPVNKEKQQTLE